MLRQQRVAAGGVVDESANGGAAGGRARHAGVDVEVPQAATCGGADGEAGLDGVATVQFAADRLDALADVRQGGDVADGLEFDARLV